MPPWHATFTPTAAGPAFVTLSPASAATSGTATLQAQFDSLPAGTYTGTVEVQPGTSPRRVKRDVTYIVQSALSVPDTLGFTIDTATTSLQQTVTVAASAGGAGNLQWSASADSRWLDLSRTSGDTMAGNQVVVSLVRAEIERLPKGIHTADITFRPPNLVPPFDFTTRTMRVVLDMRLPHTAFVMPHAVAEGSTGEAFVGGSGFSALPGSVNFGSTPAASPPTRESDTLIRANYPSTLARGTYIVDLSMPTNALGLNRAHAQLTVADPTALQGAVDDITLPIGPKYAVVFDDARHALYVANVVDASPAQPSTIERLVWNGSAWTHDSLAVPFLRDLVLRPSGDELLALTKDNITRVNLDTWTVMDAVTPLSQGPAYRSIGVGHDERLLISQADGIATNSNLIYYDPLEGASVSDFVPGVSGNIRASGDGSTIYLAGDPFIRRYDVKARTYTDNRALGGGAGRVVSVSGTGARFIIDAAAVYRSDFTKLGALSVSGDTLMAAVITPDGTRAYAYGSSRTLYTFDLETFDGTGGFQQIGAGVPLPHPVNSPVMTTSADGRAVFIAGDDRVIIKPVP